MLAWIVVGCWHRLIVRKSIDIEILGVKYADLRKTGVILEPTGQKPLVRSLIFRPISGQSPQKKPMTLIVGIVSREMIVLAGESQFTDPASGIVDYGDKISIVPLYFGEFLLAQAGLADVTNSIVEIIKEKAKSIRDVDASTIKRIISESIHELKTGYLDKEQIEHCKEHGGAQLMAAFYAEKERRLHLSKIDVFGSGLTCPPENQYYCSIGVGRWLAEYLLSEVYDPPSDENLAAAAAIYTIKKVKDFHRGACGGQTKVMMMGRLGGALDAPCIGKSVPFDQNWVNWMESEFAERDLKNKIEQRRQTIAMIHSIGQRVLEERRKQANSC